MTLPTIHKNGIILGAWALALALLVSAYAARGGLHLISHHYNIAAEANGMNGILRVADGKALYAPKTERPYAIYLYPPLHGWVLGTTLRVLGVTELAARVTLVRLLSLFFLGATLFLLWRFFVEPEGVSSKAFWLATLLVLPKFADYATTTRNDMLSLLLEVGAITLFAHWWKNRRESLLFSFLFVCLASVLTRQTGVVAFGSAVLWLTLHKQWGTTLWLLGTFLGLVAGSLYAANEITGGAFMEQAFYANLRYLPAQFQFFSLSLVSFLLSYVGFVVFVAWTIRYGTRRSTSVQLAGIAVLTSGGLALLLFFRAGGDVNYFFETLLFALPFAAMALHQLISRPYVKLACAAQMGLVAAVLFAKVHSASKTAFYPYAEAAARLKLEFEPFGILDGSLAPALNLHLQDWAYHGPDVTNGGNLGRFSHQKTRWVMGDTAIAFRKQDIHTIVVVQPDCAENIHRAPALPISRKRWNSFADAEAWYPWLCVYRRPNDPTGKPVQITSLHPAHSATR